MVSDQNKFEVKVEVRQDTVFSPTLFAVTMDEVTKNVRESGVKELLYADDLVLLEDSWKEVEMRCAPRKKVMMEKRLKVDLKKAKAICTGERTVPMSTSKFS